MNRDDVRRLEETCQKALAKAVGKELDRKISDQTCHLMAKAAVAVLEAVLDEDDA
jgi:hypothetical protein